VNDTPKCLACGTRHRGWQQCYGHNRPTHALSCLCRECMTKLPTQTRLASRASG
jgi:hypothetical protein